MRKRHDKLSSVQGVAALGVLQVVSACEALVQKLETFKPKLCQFKNPLAFGAEFAEWCTLETEVGVCGFKILIKCVCLCRPVCF